MLSDKWSLALIAGILVAICGIMVFSEASIVKAQPTSTAIEIVGKLADTPVGTITFPQGNPSDTISAPYNDVDGPSDPQFLDSSNSEPVVRLKNTSGEPLSVWLGMTGWTNGVVTAEDYELVDTTNIASVGTQLSSDGGAASVDTGINIEASAYKALYLEVTLVNQYGKSGTSTLTILGE